MAIERRFRQGDGQVTLLPDDVILLDYICRNCGRVFEASFSGGSRETFLNCDEERLCEGCEKKILVTMLMQQGTHVPEEKLLRMTLDELTALSRSEPPRLP
jgi:hypothetical protein